MLAAWGVHATSRPLSMHCQICDTQVIIRTEYRTGAAGGSRIK